MKYVYPKAIQLGQTRNNGGKFSSGQPSMLVMHYTAGGSGKGSANYLFNPHSPSSSAHLLVDRDGTVYQLSDLNIVCWHAGASSWRGKNGINNYGIGIELANWGYWRTEISKSVPDPAAAGWLRARHKNGGAVLYWEPYPEKQMKAAEDLCEWVLKQFQDIKAVDFVGHDDISPGRKSDPGPAFPWPRFRDLYDRVRKSGVLLARASLMGASVVGDVPSTTFSQDLPDDPREQNMAATSLSGDGQDSAVVIPLPWWKSKALWGVFISVTTRLLAVFFKWSPESWGISTQDWAQLTGEIFILVGFIGDGLAAKGRSDAVKSGVAKEIRFFSAPEDKDKTDVRHAFVDPGLRQESKRPLSAP